MKTDGWKECTLGDLVTFQRGHDLTVSSIEPGPYPVGGSNGPIGYHKEFTTKGPSLTLGRSGNSIGVAHYYEGNFWAHNTTLYAKEFFDADPKFIYYLLKTTDFKGHNSGSAVPSLNRNFISPYRLKVPPLHEQKRIASILSSLDEKIELNRQTAQTLEAISQAIFKEWFVDFNFPGATGEMQESELSEIPKGWCKGTINDLFSISKESVNPSSAPEAEFIHYSLPAFDEGRKPAKELGSQILSNKFKVKENSILVSKLNPRIPRVWPILEADDNHICSTEFQVFIPKREYTFSFGATLFLQQTIIEVMKGRATGTSGSHQRIRPNDILEIEIIIPDCKILENFHKVARPLFEQIKNCEEQIQSIAQLRDSLLPKLMKGEIKILDQINQNQTNI